MKKIIEKLLNIGFRPMSYGDYNAFAGAPEDSYIKYEGESIWLFSPNDPNFNWMPVLGFMKDYEDQEPEIWQGDGAIEKIFEITK